MSSLANWSYTAKATLWAFAGRDDKTGKMTYSLPRVIACDYGAENKTAIDSTGKQHLADLVFYTEFEAKRGDYISIGESQAADPFSAGAREIKTVIRYADTFERMADDYELVT